ncbi:hypothetical protein K4A83_20050 [Spirulina subsalsa FACHB-351]|uniref:DUF4336 domain-containing protein n=1 Tax=Spirulina subsalsa FACHB-351 TaxID=234711 RepID=A0ABT3LAM2_9CYAN|nr:hypothetical protein [Spirulina subsalsa]MCW6038549.1 hypothetical protein [Spirulina subsalsa FACHB-351]
MLPSKNSASEGFYRFFSFFQPPTIPRSWEEEWRNHVFPHGEIQELAPGLWHVTGVLGFTPREMVIYRLPAGGLLIHSAIALNEAGMTALESLGTPTLMIVPNRIHRLDAALFKQRYPQLQVITPQVAKPYVEEIVTVDGIAEEILPPLGIICHQPEGIRPQELVYELPLSTGKALIFTDILFNLTESYLQQFVPHRQFILHWLGAAGYFGITALGKRFFLTDLLAYQQWLITLADRILSLQIISVAHGEPITENCSQRLQEAAARLSINQVSGHPET